LLGGAVSRLFVVRCHIDRIPLPVELERVFSRKKPVMGSDARWVVRLRPTSGRSVDDLLRLPMALDVWQRETDALVAAISESTLQELERRRLAHIERIRPTSDYK